MDIKSLIKLIDGKVLNIPSDFNDLITSFTMDSRRATKGSCFIAVGKGYLYIDDAFSNGASIAITDKDLKLPYKKTIIKVNSIKNAILKIMEYIRCKHKYIPLILITGSVGKTTTKELVYSILSSKYNVLKNMDNKNNYLGISDTIFNLDDSYDFIVLEVGMNHKGEISELSKVLKPDISIITNIGTAHIGNLGSKKDILNAKLEVIDGGGKLIVSNKDRMLKHIKYQNVDMCKDIKIKNIKLKDSLNFKIIYNKNKYLINFKIPNISYIRNILLAFKVCTYFNIEIHNIINQINSFNGIKGRMNIIKNDNYTIIDDTYNASLESIKGSLDYLKRKRKKMVILGSVKELGPFEEKIHKQINKMLKFVKYRNTLLYGYETNIIDGMHFENKNDLCNYLSVLDLKGYTILIKGSHIMGMDEIVDFLNR